MLTTSIQVRAIADRLNGQDVDVEGFTEPWRTCWVAIRDALPGREWPALIGVLQGHPRRDEVITAIEAAVNRREGGARFPSLQELDEAGELKPVEWLWPSWIPVGMLSLLAAAPGAGKSMVALDLAGRIISGQSFPDGAAAFPGHSVVYVDAEAVPQIHNERIKAWGIDRSRLYLMLPTGDELFVDLGTAACRDRLVEMVAQVQPALVVVDSLSTVSLKSENAKEDVMVLLAFLSRLAQEFRCGMLLVHHLRKRRLPMYDLSLDAVRGSGHIAAAARSVLGISVVQVGPEPDRNGPRRFEVLKTNLTRYPPALGFELAPLEPQGVRVRYGPPPERYAEPTTQERCAAWLVATLAEAGEPMKPGEVVELADEVGFGRALVYRARGELGEEIVNTAGRRDPGNRWGLREWEEQEG